VPEALHRLVEAYLSLGVIKEARTAAAVLGNNYPGSEWYEDSYNLLAEYGKAPEKAMAQAPAEQLQVAAPAPAAEPAPEKTVAPPPSDAVPTEKASSGGGWFDWF
jgi:outer membrane protein assembly factor BamD